jgi:hypothetical protein
MELFEDGGSGKLAAGIQGYDTLAAGHQNFREERKG